MKRGTKEVLFGYHNWLLHPICVFLAWRRVFGKCPSWREAVCIIVHDWGYWGKDDVDGVDGENHPELGGRVAQWLFGKTWGDFARGHSRKYARKVGCDVSKLCLADKVSVLYVPVTIFIFLSKITGTWWEWEAIELRNGRMDGKTPDLVTAARHIADNVESVLGMGVK